VRNPQQAVASRYFRTLFELGSLAGLTDAELLDRFEARRTDAAELAFAVLVERHGPMVRRVCRRVLGDASSTDDALQATFLVLARKAASVRDRSSLAGWLHGVALRVALRARDSETRRRRHEEKFAGQSPLELKFDPWDDTCSVVHEELARLPERLRNVAVLCYIEGNTYEEAARQLECPILTVKSRLVESRRRLRLRLTRRGIAPASAVLATALAAEANAATTVLPPALAEIIVASACRFAINPTNTAGAVPAHIATLTQGVLFSMYWNKLKFVAASLVGVVASTALVSAHAFQAPAPAPSTTPAASPTPAPRTDVGPDRLEALERKLDRLIQVLEASKQPHALPTLPSPATVSREGAVASFTPIAPNNSFYPAPAAVLPAPASEPPMMPQAAPPPPARREGGSLERRMAELEQRLAQVERRLNQLEQRAAGRAANQYPRPNTAAGLAPDRPAVSEPRESAEGSNLPLDEPANARPARR
jgi:RNA polymerase sigma-70 factor (ECF subfamily)